MLGLAAKLVGKLPLNLPAQISSPPPLVLLPWSSL